MHADGGRDIVAVRRDLSDAIERLEDMVEENPEQLTAALDIGPVLALHSSAHYPGELPRPTTLFTKIVNRIPLGVHVSLRVAEQPDDVYTNPILKIPRDGSFSVPAAPVDADGRVTESAFQTTNVEVTKDEFLVFLKEGGGFTGVLVEIDATGGDVELFEIGRAHG